MKASTQRNLMRRLRIPPAAFAVQGVILPVAAFTGRPLPFGRMF